MTGTIYCAFDGKTGKTYVGQDWEWPARQMEHLGQPGKNFDAEVSARPDDFSWYVCVEGLTTQTQMDDAEITFGLELGALYPAGYNLMLGQMRRIASPEYGRRISETHHRNGKNKEIMGQPEMRARLSQKMKERYKDPEKREILCRAMKEAQSRPEVNEKRSQTRRATLKLQQMGLLEPRPKEQRYVGQWIVKRDRLIKEDER